MKYQNNSARASTLQITVSIALISVSAILLASSFEAAQVSGDKRLPEKESQELNSDSIQHFAKLAPHLAEAPPPQALSLADRVAYQYAIEEVYWRHRTWPAENAHPKPLLDEVMSPAKVQQKVEDYLLNSQLLADQWQQPITSKELQAEMDRMVRDTKQSEV